MAVIVSNAETITLLADPRSRQSKTLLAPRCWREYGNIDGAVVDGVQGGSDAFVESYALEVLHVGRARCLV